MDSPDRPLGLDLLRPGAGGGPLGFFLRGSLALPRPALHLAHQPADRLPDLPVCPGVEALELRHPAAGSRPTVRSSGWAACVEIWENGSETHGLTCSKASKEASPRTG